MGEGRKGISPNAPKIGCNSLLEQGFAEGGARLFHDRELFRSAFTDARFNSAGAVGKNDQGAEGLASADVAEPAERVDEAQSIHSDALSWAARSRTSRTRL